MKPASRRNTLLLGLAALVALLVGGRWIAVETAERAWAASVGGAGGGVYLATRDLARLLHGFVLLIAVAWGVANFYYVYRAVGSVQLPRRLGDLEIVEAVPQRTLLAATIGSGLVYGLLLSIGTGDWWLRALLASKPPHFGTVDPVLQRDVGYYVGQLPWAMTAHRFALRGAITAIFIVGLLYLGIGSLRFKGWRPSASAHARGHLGLLLALLALVLARGAALDPGEVVAGLHGVVDRGALVVRIPGAPFVEALGIITIFASLVWAVREQPRLLGAAWGALLIAWLAVHLVLPSVAGGGGGGSSESAIQSEPFERLAFGADWRETALPRGFPGIGAAAVRLPVWDAERVAAVTRRTPAWSPHAGVAGAALMPPHAGGGGGADAPPPPRWLVAPTPDGELRPRDSTSGQGARPGTDWNGVHRGTLARAGRPFTATEVDSVLAVTPLATRDSTFWFGPGFHEFVVAAPDTWPVTRVGGIPLAGWWRRTALAWVLQSPELARHETDGLVLLWRRDVEDRLRRLAPFATFETPTPIEAGGSLWWVSYGYVASDCFPLARSLEWPDGGTDRLVRYLHAGVVGVVNAATGLTHVYLAPGADSLTHAWARLFTPLIGPSDSLPGALLRELPYPREAFHVATAQLLRTHGDSGSGSWRARPREPYELVAPRDSGDGSAAPLWMAQAFETGSPAQLAGLLAATMSADGPSLRLWSPPSPPARPLLVPAELLGSPETAPGVMRLWSADGLLVTEQALFLQPATTGAPKGLGQLYLTWGDRASNGPTPAAALRNLLTSGTHVLSADTSLASRWELARRLATAADSALALGDLEAFGRFYGELKRLLGAGRVLAPLRERR